MLDLTYLAFEFRIIRIHFLTLKKIYKITAILFEGGHTSGITALSTVHDLHRSPTIHDMLLFIYYFCKLFWAFD
jgi:hypothetical protein